MRAYRETFRKHRILYCLPPLLVALVLGYMSFSAPKKYESGASLWVDNGPLGQSSLANAGGTAPSGSEQTLLNELVATQNFDLQVGENSSLRKYFEAIGVSKQQMSGKLADAVGAGVSSVAPGPQILNLTFTGPTPATSQSALTSVVLQLQNAMAHYGQTFGETARSYFQQQVKLEADALSRSTSAVNSYQRSHPSSTIKNDQALAALVAAEQSASSQLASVTSQLNQATSQEQGGGLSTEVRVIDPPSLPTLPTTSKKSAVEKALAGFLVGLLLSVIVIVALTPSRENRWESELSDGEGPRDLMQTNGLMHADGPVRANGLAHGNGVPQPVGVGHTNGLAQTNGVAHTNHLAGPRLEMGIRGSRPGDTAAQPQSPAPPSDGLKSSPGQPGMWGSRRRILTLRQLPAAGEPNGTQPAADSDRHGDADVPRD